MSTENTKYKDRLFCFLFGSPENRKWTLSLYNAVNGTAYTNADDIEINTIKEVLYLSMRNDVSFIFVDEMSMYEQQSTFNPNMPLRFLQYLSSLYEKYIRMRDLNKFGFTRVMLPAPKLVVFYNGIDEQPEEQELKLSQSFIAGKNGDVEVTVRMINVNAGHNRKLLEACKALQEYSWVVDRIRDGKKGMTTPGLDIISSVIDAIPADFEIFRFMKAHKSEVVDMLLTEYDEEYQLYLQKKELDEANEKTAAAKAETARAQAETARAQTEAAQAQAKAEQARAEAAQAQAEVEQAQAEVARAQAEAVQIQVQLLATMAGLIKDNVLSVSDAAKRLHMEVHELEAAIEELKQQSDQL